MKKLVYLGSSLMSVLVLIAALAGTHTAVGVASCDYCKVKVVAEVQSDALDVVAVNAETVSAQVVADNATFVNKVKTDASITASFKKSYDQVNSYAKKEKIIDDSDAIANAEFNASVFKRFNQTAKQYSMAADSLVDVSSTSLGSRQTSRHKPNNDGSVSYSASGATAKGSEQLHSLSGIGTGSPAYS